MAQKVKPTPFVGSEENEADKKLDDGLAAIDFDKFSIELGLSNKLQKENFKLMTAETMQTFYDNLIKIDPLAKEIFPNPKEDGIPDDVRIFTGKATIALTYPNIISVEWPMSAYVKILSDGSYWYTCAIYPSVPSDLFGDLLKVSQPQSALRFVLLKDGENVSDLNLACHLNVGELFSFIPDPSNKLSNITLDFSAPVAMQSTFEPLSLSVPMQFVATLSFDNNSVNSVSSGINDDDDNKVSTGDELEDSKNVDGDGEYGLKICDELWLNYFTLYPSIMNVIDIDNKLKRELYLSFKASGLIKIDDKNSSHLLVTGGNIGGELVLSAILRNWKHPFGLTGVIIDRASIRLTFKPLFSVQVSAIFSINASMLFELRGDWESKNGFALYGKYQDISKINMDSLIDIHEKVTHTPTRLDTPDPNTMPHFELENVEISLCTNDHTFTGVDYDGDDIKRQAGFEISGECQIEGSDVILDVSVSNNNGLKFSGTIKSVEIGNFITIDEAEIKFAINPKDKSKNMFSAETEFKIEEIGQTVNLAILYQNGNKCGIAEMSGIEFKLSDIDSFEGLDWLNFGFSDLRLTMSTAKMTVKGINIPVGKAIGGSAHLHLIDQLIGHKENINFGYNFTTKTLEISPQGSSFSLKNTRFSDVSGVVFEIKEKNGILSLTIGYGVSFSFLGQDMVLKGGFEIAQGIILFFFYFLFFCILYFIFFFLLLFRPSVRLLFVCGFG